MCTVKICEERIALKSTGAACPFFFFSGLREGQRERGLGRTRRAVRENCAEPMKRSRAQLIEDDDGLPPEILSGSGPAAPAQVPRQNPILPITHPVVVSILSQPFRFGLLLEENHRLPYFLERVDGVLIALDAFEDEDGYFEGGGITTVVASDAAASSSSSSSSSTTSTTSSSAAADAAAAASSAGTKGASTGGGGGAVFRGVLGNMRHQLKLLELVQRVTRREAGEGAEEVSTWQGKAATAPALRCRTPGCPGKEADISEDYRLGDAVCTKCGLVLASNYIHEGEWNRCFDDSKTTTQLGPASNPLFSHLSNLTVSHKLVDGVSKETIKRLQAVRDRAQRISESAAEGNSERRTTQAYKDDMKSKVFSAMERAGERENLSRFVVKTAKEIFARYRDSKEAVHYVHGDGAGLTPAACLVAALEADEYDRLKVLAAPKAPEEEEGGEGEVGGGGGGLDEGQPAPALPPTKEEAEAMERILRERASQDNSRMLALGIRGPSSHAFEANSRRRGIEWGERVLGAGGGGPLQHEGGGAVVEGEGAEEDEVLLFEREEARKAQANGAKHCPVKGCKGLVQHYKGHGRHDVSCSSCGTQVCFVCCAVWSQYTGNCSGKCKGWREKATVHGKKEPNNDCDTDCPFCPPCPDCKGGKTCVSFSLL